jgi:chromosome segregation ATPase
MDVTTWISIAGLVIGSGSFVGALALLIRVGRVIERFNHVCADVAALKEVDVQKVAADAAARVLENSTSALDQSFRDIHNRVTELSTRVTAASSALDNLKEGLKARLATWEKTEEQLTNAVGSINRILVQVETLNKQHDKLESRLTDAGQRISGLEASQRAMSANCDRQHTGGKK